VRTAGDGRVGKVRGACDPAPRANFDLAAPIAGRLCCGGDADVARVQCSFLWREVLDDVQRLRTPIVKSTGCFSN
jgi:hypothetical protein